MLAKSWSCVDDKRVVPTMVEGREMFLSLPVPPILNQRMKGCVRVSSSGKRYAGFRRTKEATTYQQTIKKICMARRLTPFRGDVEVELRWYRARAAGDLPERFKDLYDALEGFAYLNDSQIRREVKERDDSDKHNPRVEVTIRAYRRDYAPDHDQRIRTKSALPAAGEGDDAGQDPSTSGGREGHDE